MLGTRTAPTAFERVDISGSMESLEAREFVALEAREFVGGSMESLEATHPRTPIGPNPTPLHPYTPTPLHPTPYNLDPIRSISMYPSAPNNSFKENEEAHGFSRSFARRRTLAALWSPGILRHR